MAGRSFDFMLLLLYLRISHVQFQRSKDVKFKMADWWHFFAHASETLHQKP